jgi:hypothetical protein
MREEGEELVGPVRATALAELCTLHIVFFQKIENVNENVINRTYFGVITLTKLLFWL